ncbi:MAG: DNA sulfur modification protein DndD [Candidatus Aminicenantes bacterium]|jgi:DNA sulfur modification protein DndD
MKINKIILENVGLYSGKHEFNLSPIKSQYTNNIILFGGLNGAGKTTLFDAVKLCLYGQEMFSRINAVDYQNYLLNKIHHSESEVFQPKGASVVLEFDYSHFGDVNIYHIERKWSTNGSKKVEEKINIIKNGEILKEEKEDMWQEYINDLIPPGLSQLFFFDSEKIQKIMEYSSDKEFKKSAKLLLGLDLIERLQADLKIYRSRTLKKLSAKKFKKELDSLNQEKALIENQLNKKRYELGAIENRSLKLEDQINTCRERIRAQGDHYLKCEDSLNEKRQKLEKELEVLKDRMREIAAGVLPLSIAFSQTQKLKEQIKREKAQQANRIAREKIEENKVRFFENIKSFDLFSDLEPELKERLDRTLHKELENLLTFGNGGKVEEIFCYSVSQSERLLLLLEEALKKTPGIIKELSRQHDELFLNLRETVTQLERVPDESSIKPLYETLNKLNLEFGAIQNEKKHLDESIAADKRKIEEIERGIERINKQIEANHKGTLKIHLTKQVERALTLYKNELALQKINAFKSEFLLFFRSLHRKKDLIQQIEIDPGSFDITLYDSKKSVIKPESLSAGEKEIYAIALLTALAKSSRRNFPFIIDMPLGRLDTVHRERIIEHFFPHASHQMIIFSTNTEIDRHYFEVLKPYISHSYNLVYDQEIKRTYVEEGYFWT